MKNKKCILTTHEQQMVHTFSKMTVPFIFCSGRYSTEMQYLEYLQIDVCEDLLQGNPIEKVLLQMVLESLKVTYPLGELDEYAKEYYQLQKKVENIVKKYFHLLNW